RGDARHAAEVAQRWRDSAAASDSVLVTLARRRTRVLVHGCDDYPIRDEVPHAPAVLLAEGARPQAFDSPRVAVVGTRAATPHGIADAREVGAVLAAAGAAVVSGM